MHDKYLITDEQMYLLGGRNSNDIFLGDRETGINEDREIFVYETKTGEGASFLELEEYFSSIWEEKLRQSKEILSESREKRNGRSKASGALQRNLVKSTRSFPGWQIRTGQRKTYPVESITLIHNGTRAEKHEPMMLFAMEKLLENGERHPSYRPLMSLQIKPCMR